MADRARGLHRGYGEGRVGISQKHTLVNRGGASTAELVARTRAADEVRSAFIVTLHPEPTLVGVEL